MFVPSAIRRNQLVTMIAQSLASTKVLDQIDLPQRVANILAHGSLTSKEIIEKHKSMYPGIRAPMSIEFDIVLHHFLANMVVTWESKDPEGILFSLSKEIKQMQAEIKLKNLKTTPGLFLDIAKALVNKTDPTDFTINETIVFLMTNRQWHIDRIALKLRDDYKKEIAADMPGIMKNLANHGIVAVPEFNNDGTQWYVTPEFLNVLAELKKEKVVGPESLFDHLVHVRGNDNRRAAEGIEEYLVYLLPSEEAWQLSRISCELAEHFVISDENLAQVLEALTNANVATRRLEVILSTPTWSLSSAFTNAVEAKRKERNRREGIAKAIKTVNGADAVPENEAKKNYRASLAKFLANGDLDGQLTPAFIVASHLVAVSVTYDMLGSLLENGKDAVDDIPAAVKELQENGVVRVMLDDTTNPLVVFTTDFEKEMESYLQAGLPSGSFKASMEYKEKPTPSGLAGGGIRRDELIFVGAHTAENSSRHVHAEAVRTSREEVRSYTPKTGMRHEDTIVAPFNTQFFKGGEADATNDGAVGDHVHEPKVEVAEESIPASELKGTREFAERVHHEAFHELEKQTLEDKGVPSTTAATENLPTLPEFTLEFMGIKQTVEVARTTYGDVMTIQGVLEGNPELAKLFPPNAFDNLKQYVEQIDALRDKF